MKPRHLLKEFEQVATQLNLSVRTQAFRGALSGPGGLCKLRGERVVLLNSRSHEDERALVLAEVLAAMDTSRANMSEAAREFLFSRRAKRAAHDAARAGPGLARTRPKPEPE